MALKINLPDPGIGFDFPQAYAKIERFSGDKSRINYHVEVYANEQARQENKRPVKMMRFIADTTSISGEILAILYEHLKTQAGFENAEGC